MGPRPPPSRRDDRTLVRRRGGHVAGGLASRRGPRTTAASASGETSPCWSRPRSCWPRPAPPPVTLAASTHLLSRPGSMGSGTAASRGHRAFRGPGRRRECGGTDQQDIIHPTDLDRSIDFYGRRSTCRGPRVRSGRGPRGWSFFAGGGLIEVVAAPRAGGPHATGWAGPDAPVALWLQVRSVEVPWPSWAERGVPVARPARLEPWGLIEAWIDDPDGLRIHLVEVPPTIPSAGHPRSPEERRRDGRAAPRRGHRPRAAGHAGRAPGPRPGPRPSSTGLLGTPRVPKPPELAARAAAGSSAARPRSTSGSSRTSGRPARPTRPWWCPTSVPWWARLDRLPRHPVRPRRGGAGEARKWYVDDPFGNRIELDPAAGAIVAVGQRLRDRSRHTVLATESTHGPIHSLPDKGSVDRLLARLRSGQRGRRPRPARRRAPRW